ncbi:MAG: T9SS type A sorting domain-containing protein [Bacteroidota bacterium]
MKKQLLLGSALLAAISAFPQNAKTRIQPAGKLDMGAVLAQKYAAQLSEPAQSAAYQGPQASTEDEVTAERNAATSISWALLCGSMNTYGMLVQQSRPLQYNAAVNAVSFIHRKSGSYTPFPAANSNAGTIVAEISSNWGQTWDSTCIWSDATNGGRYPQGAIFNPPGNTNIANAYVVGCGPIVANNAFTGDWYGSKQLGAAGSAAYNTTASAAPGAQQFLSFTLPSYPANQGPHGWSRYGFTSINGGVVRSLALIQDDQTGLSTMRGVSVVKGTFNAGVFAWTTDSIIPPTVIESGGSKVISSEVQMAFNEAGTVGYICVPGALATSQGQNRGYQPIIYKTTNSGGSWSLLPVINFASPAMAIVTDHLVDVDPVSAFPVPYMVDYDMTVDANNQLHIGAIFCSAAIANDDSLNYIAQFTTSINPNDKYKWAHLPGNRPYLYDFVGDGTSPWKAAMVDSISSEGPSASSGYPGYSDNPWDNTGTGGAKISIEPRIQMGRTPDGKFINVSWTETDSAFIAQSKKWNIQPNIKARSIAIYNTVTTGAYSTFCNVSNNEINVTKPTSAQGTQHPKVVNRATLHYMSPTTGSAAVTAVSGGTYSAEYNVPFTVTNSSPYSQLTNNATWYTSAKLNFEFGAKGVGINEIQANNVSQSLVYPNPANGNAFVKLTLSKNENVQISVMNIVGQVVKTTSANGNVGENNIQFDLSGLNSGVYMVTVKVGNNNSTKKIVVE